MSSRQVVAKNLRMFRERLGLSQEELAHKAGVDRTYVSSLERQRYGATVDTLDKLAFAMGIKTADLLQNEIDQ